MRSIPGRFPSIQAAQTSEITIAPMDIHHKQLYRDAESPYPSSIIHLGTPHALMQTTLAQVGCVVVLLKLDQSEIGDP